MKKTLSILLVLAMIASLTACGNAGSSAESAASEAAATTAQASKAPAASTAPAATAAASSAEEASVTDAEASTSEGSGDAMAAMQEDYISYPLDGDNTITMWYYTPPYVQYVDSNANFTALPYAEKATGVHIDFTEVGSASASEQFNLMVASADMPDLIPAREYYTGGLTKAYDEDIIVDINDYVDKDMPNYAAVLKTLPEKTQKETLSDGKMLAFSTINDGTYSGSGFITRGDWMDALGISFGDSKLISLDQFTDLMTQMHEKYNTPYTYYMTSNGQVPLQAAFDTEIPALMGDGFMTTVTSSIFRQGDTCMSGWTTDGYREYLEWVLKMFDEGVLYKDFLSLSTDRGDTNTAQGAGQVAVWTANADKMEEILGYTDDPDFKVAALPNVAKNPDDPYVWQQETSLVSTNNGFSISASCQQPDLVCQWMNYFWTEAGYYMANYGVEDVSYKKTGDDVDFMWDTPKTVTGATAPNAEMALELFTMKRFVSFYAKNDRLLPTFPDSALKAVDLWTFDGAKDERYYPTTLKASFTTEENEEIAQYESDFLTYAQETVLKFLDGSLELNDDNWNAYVDQCNASGLPKIIEVYQNAYDQYKAGTR